MDVLWKQADQQPQFPRGYPDNKNLKRNKTGQLSVFSHITRTKELLFVSLNGHLYFFFTPEETETNKNLEGECLQK